MVIKKYGTNTKACNQKNRTNNMYIPALSHMVATRHVTI